MDPHIIISPPPKPKFNKNLLAGIVVGIMLLAIPLGVYLVQQTQIFKPKATDPLPYGPETSFSLRGPMEFLYCIKAPCPVQLTSKPIPVGQKFQVQVLVRADIDSVNALLASLKFPKDLLEVTGIQTEGDLGLEPQAPPEITCSGVSDNSCPTGTKCTQKCGPPVEGEGDPLPGYSCINDGNYIESTQSGQLTRNRTNCPICLAKDTKISTPNGEVNVQSLRKGDVVWSKNSNGDMVASKILKTSAVSVPKTHQVILLKLRDGRTLSVSPGHPAANNLTSDQLRVGDKYDGSVITGVDRVNYEAGKTYDLLPDSDTGFYFANGILMGSTLKPQVQGISTAYAQATGSGQSCAQVITRACAREDMYVGPDGIKCKEFPTPCEVPQGWVPVQDDRPILGPLSGYFIQNWIEKKFDNNAGTISLIGGIPSPGFKTENGTYAVMATITFAAKAAGAAQISFTDDSLILRNSDSANILGSKRNLEIKIAAGELCESPLPQCKEGEDFIYGDPGPGSPNKCPVYRCVPKISDKGDGNKDGKIDLADLSVLLSNYGKSKLELDYNDDGIINGLDYSSMVKYLLDNKIIRVNQ